MKIRAENRLVPVSRESPDSASPCQGSLHAPHLGLRQASLGRAFQGAWAWVGVLAPHWRPKQVQKLPQDRHHSGVSLSPPPSLEESRDKALI